MSYPSLCLTLAEEHKLTEGIPLAKELGVYNEVLPFWQALITHYLFSQMGRSPLTISDQFVLAYGIYTLGLTFDTPIDTIVGEPISADQWCSDQDKFARNIAKCVIPKLRQLYHRELTRITYDLETKALWDCKLGFENILRCKLFPFNTVPVPGSVKQCGDNLINAARYARSVNNNNQSTVVISAHHTFLHRLQVVLSTSTKSMNNGNCMMVSRNWIEDVISSFPTFWGDRNDLNQQYQKVSTKENVNRILIHSNGKCLSAFMAMIIASGLNHFMGFSLCDKTTQPTTDVNINHLLEPQLDVWFTRIPLWKAYESTQPIGVRLLVPANEDRVYCLLNRVSAQLEHRVNPNDGCNKQEVRVTTTLDIFQRFNKAVNKRSKQDKSIIVE